jgi:hypothetical protein
LKPDPKNGPRLHFKFPQTNAMPFWLSSLTKWYKLFRLSSFGHLLSLIWGSLLWKTGFSPGINDIGSSRGRVAMLPESSAATPLQVMCPPGTEHNNGNVHPILRHSNFGGLHGTVLMELLGEQWWNYGRKSESELEEHRVFILSWTE